MAESRNPGTVAGIILAAGLSSRMGRSKPLLPWQGRPLLAQVIENALLAPLSPLVLVLGFQAREVFLALERCQTPLDRILCVTNPDPARGMAGSIRAGLSALDQAGKKVRGALFLLGDMPRVGPSLIREVLDQAKRFPDRIIQPMFQGRPGHPVYFGPGFFPELRTLAGDQGGRILMAQYPSQVMALETRDPGACLDLDTQAQYRSCLARGPAPLITAMGLTFPAIVTAVGGGGKTSLLFALAREAAGLKRSALVTTTTAMYRPDPSGTPGPGLFLGPVRELTPPGPGQVLVAASHAWGHKIKGYDPEAIFPLLCPPCADLILIEGDGARMRPVKAPGDHEPVIPAPTQVVAGCIGLDCLGLPLDDPHVHRPELLAALAGQALGSPVTPFTLARLISHEKGLFKGVPPGAVKVLVLNKADTPERLNRAGQILAALGPGQVPDQSLVTCLSAPGEQIRSLP